MRTLIAALLASLPLAAIAETPMTAEAFDAYVTGKTLTYSQFGLVFGTEEYLPGRKVRWSVAENTCDYGSWYPQGENICFVYEYDPTPHCWTFWQGGTGLKALSVEMAPGAELSEVNQTDTPLACPGPDVGA
ncbi:hypothetical protein [Tabrizicola sp. BL-A-41-H6]|uniref:hypothetical protein n=1 Tax=Tabrizicola sp. BL-A-41-H6 TaxID=3421107 RepID=UPI003D67CB5E